MFKAWIPAFAGMTLLAVPAVVQAKVETIQIKTTDGGSLPAILLKPTQQKPLVIMLHGLGSGKGEWKPLCDELAKAGWGYLAYDSQVPGVASDKWVDHLGAAVRTAENSGGVPRSKIFLIGASVGANICAKYAALTGVGRGVVLLSPGLDYQGLLVADSVIRIRAPILVVVSASDEYSASTALHLKELFPRTEVWSDVKPGHGAQMFDPALLARLVEWFKKQKVGP